MKRKIGRIAALVAISTGLIAPTVEAGRTLPSVSCTYTLSGLSISVTGSFSGTRFASIDQSMSNPIVDYAGGGLSQVASSATWTQTGRKSGTYSSSGSLFVEPILVVSWILRNARGSVINQNSCTAA
jgi:hypothetical protein